MHRQRPGRLHTSSLAAKAEMRVKLRTRRAACDPAWGQRLAGHVLADSPPPAGAVVAGYWPLPGEIDIRFLLLALAGRGHGLALPATPAIGFPLVFHRWRFGAPLIPGRFGTFHPPPDPVTPDVVLVPLLGFDRDGARLGYGGGYYDRTLAALPPCRTIGCGFAAGEVDAVPAEAHDRRLDAIATERGMIRVE